MSKPFASRLSGRIPGLIPRNWKPDFDPPSIRSFSDIKVFRLSYQEPVFSPELGFQPKAPAQLTLSRRRGRRFLCSDSAGRLPGPSTLAQKCRFVKLTCRLTGSTPRAVALPASPAALAYPVFALNELPCTKSCLGAVPEPRNTEWRSPQPAPGRRRPHACQFTASGLKPRCA